MRFDVVVFLVGLSLARPAVTAGLLDQFPGDESTLKEVTSSITSSNSLSVRDAAKVRGLSYLFLQKIGIAAPVERPPYFSGDMPNGSFQRALLWGDYLHGALTSVSAHQARMFFLSAFGNTMVLDFSYEQVLEIAERIAQDRAAIAIETPDSVNDMLYSYLQYRKMNLSAKQFVALLHLATGPRFFKAVEDAFVRIIGFSITPWDEVFELSSMAQTAPDSAEKARSDLIFHWQLEQRAEWTAKQRSDFKSEISKLEAAGVGVNSKAFVLSINMEDARCSVYLSSRMKMTGAAATNESDIASQIREAQDKKPKPDSLNDEDAADWWKAT